MYSPTVSIIIIFLNAEKFIREAIDSVFAQTYNNWELLLVDDGSTDASTDIALRYARQYPGKVRYLEHEGHKNRGMSASRNLGIYSTRAEFIAFLDADDIWLPDKLKKQVEIMRQYPDVGLLFSCTFYWSPMDGVKRPQPITVSPGWSPQGAWLPEILENDNNAACPSAALMRRELALRVGGFEDTFRPPLRVMEDQAMWFKATLNAPIYYHPECLALYRIHSESSCVSDPLKQQLLERAAAYSWLIQYLEHCHAHQFRAKFIAMTWCRLCDTLLHLANLSQGEAWRHPANSWLYRLRTYAELARDYRRSLGLAFSTLLLIGAVSDQIASGLCKGAFAFFQIAYKEGWLKAAKVFPRYLVKDFQRALPRPLKSTVKRAWGFVTASKARIRLTIGVQALSNLWGFDRGMPIHRYYLEEFLREFASDIRGDCLEFQEDSYTTRFGSPNVTKLDILHIDDSNPLATVVADLTKPNNIPSNLFDCIICTHVLHVIFELDKAVSELYRILKPGGVLLVAVPHVSMCDPRWHEIWRFTPEGLHLVLAKAFGAENVTGRAYGNSLTAAGEIRGLVVHEFTKAEIDYHDPRFAVEVCARAVKRGQPKDGC